MSVQSDTWTAQFTDETGAVRRVSTKTTNRSVAEKILARYEAGMVRSFHRSDLIVLVRLDNGHLRGAPIIKRTNPPRPNLELSAEAGRMGENGERNRVPSEK